MPPQSPPKKRSQALLIAALTIILIGVLLQILRRGDSNTEANPPETVAVTPAPVNTVEPTPAPRRDPSLPFSPRSTVRPANDGPDREPTDEERWNEKLAGPWRGTVTVHGVGIVEEFRDVTVRREDDSLMVSYTGLQRFFYHLSLDGYRVRDIPVGSDASGRLEGSISPRLDEISLDGVRFYRPSGYLTIQLEFFQLTDEELAHEARIKQYQNELRSISDAAYRYASENADEMPPTLAALVPRYLQDSSFFHSDNHRIVSYNPSGTPLHKTLTPTWGDPLALHDPYDMIAQERELEAFWNGGFLVPIPWLTVEFPNDEIVFEVASTRGVYIVAPARNDTLAIDPRFAYRSAQNTLGAQMECAERMYSIRQRANVFRDSHVSGRYPPGLHSMAWESRGKLTCPSVEPGTYSYAFAFPAANDADLDGIYESATGEPADEANRKKAVPFLIELHDCAGGYARHVAYLNGEVELLTPDEWRDRVEPFLNAVP